jgi:hypothetical protein
MLLTSERSYFWIVGKQPNIEKNKNEAHVRIENGF